MSELHKKIKLKLSTLVESKINEAPVLPGAVTLESLIAKYGQKLINIFGDDVVRAAEVNMGDDVVKLLGKSVDDATLLTLKNGERAFITQSGKRNVPLRWIKEDMMKINVDPSKYDEIVGRYGELQLKNGTKIKDFFSRPKPLPKPKVPNKFLKNTKTAGNEFVKGWQTKTGIGTLVKIVKKPFRWLAGKETEKLRTEDWIRLGGWLGTGVGDLNQVIRNLQRLGVKDKILYTIVNVGGQFAGRVWWWTWRLTLIELLYQLALDWKKGEVLYEDFESSVVPRIERAWTWGGLSYIVPWMLVWKELKPILDYLFKGGGSNQTIKKTELVGKVEKLFEGTKNGLDKIKIEADKKYQENRNKIDSIAAAAAERGFLPPDTTSLLNTPINQSQPQSQQPQQTREKPKPKWVDPWNNQ
jgi:hypothetical protein